MPIPPDQDSPVEIRAGLRWLAAEAQELYKISPDEWYKKPTWARELILARIRERKRLDYWADYYRQNPPPPQVTGSL